MAVLENRSPFAGEMFTGQDAEGRFYVTAILRATYFIAPGGELFLAEEQEPPLMEDVYYGEPESSSLKFASDAVLTKPATDVAVVGSAYSPSGSPVEEVEVDLIVEGRFEKKLLVFGDRYWESVLGVSRISPPEPFEVMPITYENAYGGADTSHKDPGKHTWEKRNPVGKGFRTRQAVDGLPLPNVEHADDLISRVGDRPEPAGFGFIAPNWSPRVELAGTYDEKWLEEQCPLMPEDLQIRFFQAAHPHLICEPYLTGEEEFRILGMNPEGEVAFRLPGIGIGISVDYRGNDPFAREAPLDTVIVQPDERKLSLVWRATIACPRRIADVPSVLAFDARIHSIQTLLGNRHAFGL